MGGLVVLRGVSGPSYDLTGGEAPIAHCAGICPQGRQARRRAAKWAGVREKKSTSSMSAARPESRENGNVYPVVARQATGEVPRDPAKRQERDTAVFGGLALVNETAAAPFVFPIRRCCLPASCGAKQTEMVSHGRIGGQTRGGVSGESRKCGQCLHDSRRTVHA